MAEDRITELANRYGVDEEELAQFAEFTAKGMAAKEDPAAAARFREVDKALKAERDRTRPARRPSTVVPGC